MEILHRDEWLQNNRQNVTTSDNKLEGNFVSCPFDSNIINYVSHIMKNLSSEVCDRVRLKLASSAYEACKRFPILDMATKGIILSRQWIGKVPIRLCW